MIAVNKSTRRIRGITLLLYQLNTKIRFNKTAKVANIKVIYTHILVYILHT